VPLLFRVGVLLRWAAAVVVRRPSVIDVNVKCQRQLRDLVTRLRGFGTVAWLFAASSRDARPYLARGARRGLLC